MGQQLQTVHFLLVPNKVTDSSNPWQTLNYMYNTYIETALPGQTGMYGKTTHHPSSSNLSKILGQYQRPRNIVIFSLLTQHMHTTMRTLERSLTTLKRRLGSSFLSRSFRVGRASTIWSLWSSGLPKHDTMDRQSPSN